MQELWLAYSPMPSSPWHVIAGLLLSLFTTPTKLTATHRISDLVGVAILRHLWMQASTFVRLARVRWRWRTSNLDGLLRVIQCLSLSRTRLRDEWNWWADLRRMFRSN